MDKYNFKRIAVIPPAKDLINIVLSKTQRKTPTVIHKHYNIVRIRGFYMRKIKFCQQTLHDKLTTILTDFPNITELSPFYVDLMSILYDKDHYKVALAQVNNARHLIDDLAKDHVRLMKFGDTMFRCKQLKRMAFGKMVKIIKRLGPNLQYLEEVRQHSSRLPSIDPNARTLLLCGFPNVGKSSFINKITRADVEVQPYAFTTKNLYVGHTDFKFIRYQVVDTPGLLDHPCDEMNTIEMQSLTALTHLRALIIFIMDLSEQCEKSVEEQVSLFLNLKKMVFKNKPVLVVCNKTDVVSLSELPEHKQDLVRSLENECIGIMHMSTMSDEGVMAVKTEACQRLLDLRVESKLNTKRAQDVSNRLFVAYPKKRDEIVRPAVAAPVHNQAKKRKLQRDIAAEMDDDYFLDLRKEWDLVNPDDRYYIAPEIFKGKNVADYIDPNIDEKLARLMEEEKLKEEAGLYDSSSEDEEEKEMERQLELIKERRKIRALEAKMKDRSASIVRSRKRKREQSEGPERMESQPRSLTRSKSRAASASRPPRDQSGLRDQQMVDKVKKIGKKAQKQRNHQARKGEGDRVILDMKPKHLFSGKRKAGKTDRR